MYTRKQTVCTPNFQCSRGWQLPSQYELLIIRSRDKRKIEINFFILQDSTKTLLNLQPESQPTVAYRRATNREHVFLQV